MLYIISVGSGVTHNKLLDSRECSGKPEVYIYFIIHSPFGRKTYMRMFENRALEMCMPKVEKVTRDWMKLSI